MRIFGKVALNARCLLFDHCAQRLQLGNDAIDLLHRGTGHALHQRLDAVGEPFADRIATTSE